MLIRAGFARLSNNMLRIIFSAVLTAATVLGQSPAPPPAFDVASIKASPAERRGGEAMLGENIKASPGSLNMRHVTLKTCIAWAYHVFEYQVNGPEWIGLEHYEVAAKAAGPATEPELRAMLQTLLADRFQLTFHRQTKEMQAFVLTVGKNGPKFHESKTEGDSILQPDPKTMTVAVHRVSVAQMIDPLSRMFQLPVVDMTGLTGRYDVTMNIAKYIPQNGEKADPLSIIQTGLQEELGLKLEQKKVPVDLLIVDHAEKAPVEN
jgi:uncharacterized protein (TIGR03435 family)